MWSQVRHKAWSLYSGGRFSQVVVNTDLTALVFLSGFYTGWLLPAAVVGVLVFLYGVATMDMNQIALEVCNEGSKYEVN